ncbi:MAG: acyl-CoA carboxylase biotin carboxyl carrier protein subunit [Planctomycetota bacterium]|jgi:3-methylcrotonyl-CoA carboxylase alpha subunit
MSTFSFQVMGRLVSAECMRDRKRLVVRHEGREIAFVPHFRGETDLQMRIGNRTVAAVVLRVPDGVHVSVEGEIYHFRFMSDSEEPLLQIPDTKLEPGSHTLKVPMPGTVAKVLVSEGESVIHCQPLVVVEAMKMENSVRAPAPCKIGKIHVAGGDVVNPGDPLLEMTV